MDDDDDGDGIPDDLDDDDDGDGIPDNKEDRVIWHIFQPGFFASAQRFQT